MHEPGIPADHWLYQFLTVVLHEKPDVSRLDYARSAIDPACVKTPTKKFGGNDDGIASELTTQAENVASMIHFAQRFVEHCPTSSKMLRVFTRAGPNAEVISIEFARLSQDESYS